MCGEHGEWSYFAVFAWGSSPHVRGTPPRSQRMAAARGIIPACAGNTDKPTEDGGPDGDHPRMCGEHKTPGHGHTHLLGSSPHVRGTLLSCLRIVHRRGIIPACAGNTIKRWVYSRRTWDHPRMCGEHRTTHPSDPTKWGSSPHVRGTRFRADLVPGAPGIIPACAGNTLLSPAVAILRRDHPRMCGEHW